MKVYIDVSLTAHSPGQSGIEQVTRQLCRYWPEPPQLHPLVMDRYGKCYRAADLRERRWLQTDTFIPYPHSSRQRRWSDWQKLRGWMLRWRWRWSQPVASLAAAIDPDSALLLPELFHPAADWPIARLRQHCRGPVAAVFHDAIPLRFPEWSSAAVRSNFPEYLRRLSDLDAVAAVSTASRTDLLAAWHQLGCTDLPPVAVIGLGVGPRAPAGKTVPATSAAPAAAPSARLPSVLMVSTIEPRKNHQAALAAVQALWAEGLRFRMVFAGATLPDTAAAWQASLQRASAPEGCLVYHGRVSPQQLDQLYKEATVCLYPSLYEGFGLPVLEALQAGLPCVCSDRGGLADFVHRGGCLVVDPQQPAAIAAALRELLTPTATRQRLLHEIRHLAIPTWQDYAARLHAWLLAQP